MPLDVIHEEDSQVSMAELPSKVGLQLKKNAIMDAKKKEEVMESESSIESYEGKFEDNSRDRWYEYYKGIGYTHEKLVEMGLTKPIDKSAINNFNVKDVMAQLKKQNTVNKKESPRKPIDSSARKPIDSSEMIKPAQPKVSF